MLDTLTLFGFGAGLGLAALLYILLRKGWVRINALPVVLGVGGGIYTLIGSLAAGAFLLPTSKWPAFAAFSLALSVGIGVVVYFGTSRIVHRGQRKS